MNGIDLEKPSPKPVKVKAKNEPTIAKVLQDKIVFLAFLTASVVSLIFGHADAALAFGLLAFLAS